VDTPPFQSALQLWVNMVKDGSASKSVLNWGQDPDLTQQFIQGHAAIMQQASTMEHVTSLMYYLPTKPAVTEQVLKGGPEYTVFAKETQTGRSRTTEYGANYPKVSQAIWTAIQSAITGTSSVNSALQTAQGTISGVQLVSGG
jgi:ABC-type glycerol-3-phosphate transport system substrate-binding protein